MRPLTYTVTVYPNGFVAEGDIPWPHLRSLGDIADNDGMTMRSFDDRVWYFAANHDALDDDVIERRRTTPEEQPP